MDTKVVITIDTEPDNLWDPNLRKSRQFNNISELPTLQRLFDKFRARPTYLTTFSVAKSDCVSVLRDMAKSAACEIGSHLHADETPPIKPQLRGDGTYLQHYAVSIQNQKMENLDNAITEAFGHKSVSYRAGRYSFDKNTAGTLSKYGYLVDTSVTPGISWESYGGPNFKKFGYKDYFIHSGRNSDLLEVPVSIKIKSRIPEVSKFLYLNLPIWTRAEGILRRTAAFDIVWLDPSFNSYEKMKWLSGDLLEEGVSCLNIMFHSSAAITGGTPYTMKEEDTRNFFERLERLLEYLLKNTGLETFTLKEFYAYRRNSLARVLP